MYVCHCTDDSVSGESGEAEPVEGNHRVPGPDSDLMDGEAEGDTVVIAGQPEVLSTQAMQVVDVVLYRTLKRTYPRQLPVTLKVICCH